MTPYIVSVPSRTVAEAYARWKGLDESPRATIMHDGWTLPALCFERLYEAQAAALDLAMIAGSVNPFRPHEVLITEFHGRIEEFCR